MAAKKTTVRAPVIEPVRVEKDAYEEGVFAALELLRDYVDAECQKLRDVDAGCATGLLGPVVNMLGDLRSRVDYKCIGHLHERRAGEQAAKVTP